MFRTSSCVLAVVAPLLLAGCDRSSKASPAPESPRPPTTSALHTPEKDSAERKAILDALRPAVESELEQKVVFVIDHLAVKDGFAFLTGRPAQPSGQKIDYRKTRYRQNLEDGVFDDNLSALLRDEGAGWKRVTHALGSTDVPWVDWAEKYSAPKEIFPRGVE